MSLRDELLKAGLVPSDQAKKLESENRKQAHQAKKSKTLAAEEAARQTEARQRAEVEVAHKREQDRQLNLKREAEKQRREQAVRARQLIDGHRLNDADAELPYNFQEGRFIRSIRVTAAQRKALALGRMAIVRGYKSQFDWVVTPRETALKLAEFIPERVLLLYDESSGDEGEEDWGDW
jgi:uncharacterized protein YaiL (DUF2058 family)